MDHRVVARGLLALICGLQGLAAPAVDLSRTHATNPKWPGHARFHLVWQVITASLLSALEIGLIWWSGPYVEERFYLASTLTCIPLLAFFTAVISRKGYDGSLSDPNGIPPARIVIFGTVHHIDLNIVAVGAALLMLATSIAIYNW